MRTSNPLILLLLIIATSIVVAVRQPATQWGRSFGFFIRLALIILAVRMLLQVLIGPAFGTSTLISLPHIPLPEWFAGVRLGGPIMRESLVMGFYDGLRLATLVIIFGAANCLASPTRMLKSVPAAVYEFGVSVVIAVSFTPQLVTDVKRVQQARRLRGRPSAGVRGIASAAIPVFEGALDRSIALAAAMDARGYGRRTNNPHQQFASTLLVLALIALVIGIYGLIATQTSAYIGAPLIAFGIISGGLGLYLSGRSSERTRYRPDPWRAPEWFIATSGAFAALLFSAADWNFAAALHPSTIPLQWPTVPWFAWIVFAVALVPALAAPPTPVDYPSEEVVEIPAPPATMVMR
jgi:energy-coupling factor transport system permease protein